MPKERIVPRKPALLIEGQKKYIVITDLHIGFENSLVSNEIFVGKNSTINETVDELLEIIELENPDSVILLGDVKSSIKNIFKTEWNDVPLFFKKIKEKCNVILIPGNHDANIQRLVPEDVSLISSTGMVEDNTLFTHGHRMPSEIFAHVKKIIMGHVHPVFFQKNSIVNGQRV
ncbi:MAG TPA: metallophosphoesterase [Nitrosopumilaceae archaeon]|nr:metallophosphoesterase [Nitrosopumilaceae archaeon]